MLSGQNEAFSDVKIRDKNFALNAIRGIV